MQICLIIAIIVQYVEIQFPLWKLTNNLVFSIQCITTHLQIY